MLPFRRIGRREGISGAGLPDKGTTRDMPTPHIAFSLWMFLSVCIHVAMLTFWPLPAPWELGKPTILMVELYPPGESDGNQPEAREGSPAGTPTPSTRPLPEKNHSQPPVPHKRTTEAVSNRKDILPRGKTGPAVDQKAPDTLYRPAMDGSGEVSGGTAPASESANAPLSSLGDGPGTSSISGNGQPGTETGHGENGRGSYRASPLGYGSATQIPYPKTARRRGWQGEVLLKVAVTADGTVATIQIEKSSGYDMLDQSAREAVALWIFRPARRNGQPIADTVLVPVRFELQNGL